MVNFSVYTAYNKHNTALKVFYTLFTHSPLLYENLTRQTALTCLTSCGTSTTCVNNVRTQILL